VTAEIKACEVVLQELLLAEVLVPGDDEVDIPGGWEVLDSWVFDRFTLYS